MRISDWSSDVCSSDLYLNLALAKEYEDLGQYPLAFEHLGAGKSSPRDSRRYAFARHQALFDALMHATPVPAAGAVGNASDEPIFAIGMPRSGTTLVDRILSSHPPVHSAGDIQNFGLASQPASGRRPERKGVVSGKT